MLWKQQVMMEGYLQSNHIEWQVEEGRCKFLLLLEVVRGLQSIKSTKSSIPEIENCCKAS